MSYDAINKYNKENYEKLAIRVPKGKKAILENLSKMTGQSINMLVLGAVEEKYGVNLHSKDKPISDAVRQQYMKKRMEFFEDINYDRIADILTFVKEKTDKIIDNQMYIEKVDILMSKLIMAYYDKKLDKILDDYIF